MMQMLNSNNNQNVVYILVSMHKNRKIAIN